MRSEFASLPFPSLGVEVTGLAELLARVPSQICLRPQRAAFHVLLLFNAGRGRHKLDFEPVRCGPGTVVHVRPGQVHQFDPADSFEASVVVFQLDFLPPEPPSPDATLLERALPGGSATLQGGELEGVAHGFASLAREYARTNGSRSGGILLQHLVHALLLRLARCGGTGVAGSRGAAAYLRIYRHFRRSLERDFIRSRRVSEYAGEIGVSEKTLGRACHALAGLSPARLIEERVLLEAKRLLAYTDLPASSIAGHLGFDEPTNFAKFFRRHMGTTPINFRTGLESLPQNQDVQVDPGSARSAAAMVAHQHDR